MISEAWRRLHSLESRDIVSKWFSQLHGRELNSRRSREIAAAARQAREYFRNAENSDFSVKPLLAFYGVASLSRSLTLLLTRDGGEETLSKGHGLETQDWSATLSGELSVGLARIGDLTVQMNAGLFSDLVKATDNVMTVHIRSSAVDWRLPFPAPKPAMRIQLKDLLGRLPDLIQDYSAVGAFAAFGTISTVTYIDDTFRAHISTSRSAELGQIFAAMGYTTTENGKTLSIEAKGEVFKAAMPQFSHAYVNKLFDSIPNLYIVAPLPSGDRLSQLAMTYVLSFILGMLARYFPTHWIALIQGEKGDILWPTINNAYRIVEQTFPELVHEFITDQLANRNA